MREVKKKDLKVFSLIWAFIFLVIALAPLVNNEDVKVWSLSVSILFILISLLKPSILTGFYFIWVKIGEFIGGIISKIIMFILYFGLFTPISFILKLIGKDLLNKKVDKDVHTYWIHRKIQPQSMKNQF